ncbi:MAG TPA: VOC family protein [Stellaceae bacterium]|nr:VOC family protein [Stellaceae bacterium]
MITHFDHVTIVVRDIARAKEFFALLGFVEQRTVMISGERFSRYMGIAGIEAEHVTLALADANPHVEVQLLRYHHPDPIRDPDIVRLNKLGFNHVCFAVDDIEAEVRKLRASGVETRNDIMEFHDRKLIFIAGPEGVTVELAQWTTH